MLSQHISDTALLVNESRARDTALSLDELAREWIPEEARARIAQLWDDFAQEVYPHDDLELALRSRYYIEQLRSFQQRAGGPFVNLGAGLTSYPYIVECPRSLEVDYPPLSEFKKERTRALRSAGVLPERDVRFVPADLNAPEARERVERELTEFTGKQASFAMAEGVLYYLEPGALSETLSLLRRVQSKGSILALDYWSEAFTHTALFARQERFFEERFGFTAPQYTFVDKEDIHHLQGYRVLEAVDLAELERKYTDSDHLQDEAQTIPNPIVVLERTAD